MGVTMRMDLGNTFKDRTVLVTGHTGFKGAWLSLWLDALGAKVTGFSLPPPTNPSLFRLARLDKLVDHRTGDVRDYAALRRVVKETKPAFIFHLAAQSLVRTSYAKPLETLETNIMGTANLLAAVQELNQPCSVVLVTSDKCYENREKHSGYRESDPMGGNDPYSASKGCAELVAACWKKSFFSRSDRIRIATARAGNVIGGGDWATDRIVPDCIRALCADRPVLVRNPASVRPWQHVLDPLNGYLTLASRMSGNLGHDYCGAWNFGPESRNIKTVHALVDETIRCWGSGHWRMAKPVPAPVKETSRLVLNCRKAKRRLGWHPFWSFNRSVRETTLWYRAWRTDASDMLAVTRDQIEAFAKCANTG
ncbi:MAG: CDP-glucose 4,6-dehydratase [bacterium]